MTTQMTAAISTRDNALIQVLEVLDQERDSLLEMLDYHRELPTKGVANLVDSEPRITAGLAETFKARYSVYVNAQLEVERIAALPVKTVRHYRAVNTTRDVLVVKGMSPRGALDCIHLGADLGQDSRRWERHGVGRDEAWDYIAELREAHGPSSLAVSPY